jgi:hypothetical protein
MAEEGTPQRVSPWRVPLTLAAAGLVLMLAGYALLSYTPVSPRRQLQHAAENDPQQREPEGRVHIEHSLPWRPAGTVAFYAGLLLFLAAGLRMYRQPPQPPSAQDGEQENLQT